MTRTRFVRAAVPAVLLLLVGCYSVSEQDGVKTYAFAGWVPVVLFLVGLCLGYGGVQAFRHWSRQLGVMLVIAALLFGLAVPAMVLVNKVVVDDRHFVVTDCFLWTIEHNDVAYADIVGAHVAAERTRSRGGESMKYTLELTTKTGPRSIVVKNAFKHAWPEVARQLRAHGFDNLPEELPE